MALGFFFNLAGSLFLGFVTTQLLTFSSVLIGLALMGIGVGFTMGAPLNYLVLQTVPKEESASGLATMSLMRSIGLAVSPSIMIGFIVNAAKDIQPKLMELLSAVMPKGMSIPSGSTGGADAFKALQSADITTIAEALKNALGSVVPEQVRPMLSKAIDPLSDKITAAFQSIMNSGYTDMYIAAAAIAACGLAATLFLKKKEIKLKAPSNKISA